MGTIDIVKQKDVWAAPKWEICSRPPTSSHLTPFDLFMLECPVAICNDRLTVMYPCSGNVTDCLPLPCWPHMIPTSIKLRAANAFLSPYRIVLIWNQISCLCQLLHVPPKFFLYINPFQVPEIQFYLFVHEWPLDVTMTMLVLIIVITQASHGFSKYQFHLQHISHNWSNFGKTCVLQFWKVYLWKPIFKGIYYNYK